MLIIWSQCPTRSTVDKLFYHKTLITQTPRVPYPPTLLIRSYHFIDDDIVLMKFVHEVAVWLLGKFEFVCDRRKVNLGSQNGTNCVFE